MLLIDPVGKAGQQFPPGRAFNNTVDVVINNNVVVADVYFWFSEATGSGKGKGVKQLCTSHPPSKKSDDGYGAIIPCFPELVCVDKHLALSRIRTTDRGVPTRYYVHSFDADGIKVDQLPDIPTNIYGSCSSIGLLRIDDDGRFAVANLQLLLDDECECDEPTDNNSITTAPMQLKARIDMCSPSYKKETKWTHQEVLLSFPNGTVEDKSMLCQWQTDQVISMGGSLLLWVDLWLGIQSCSSLLLSSASSPGEDPKPLQFQYVPLPDDLAPKRPFYDRHYRRERPEPFRSVACCQGKLKLVNLRFPDDQNRNSLEVQIWNNHGAPSWAWSKQGNYMYNQLWDTVIRDRFLWQSSLPLPPSNRDKPWYFPVLSTHNSDILYLTLEALSKAFLVRIDVKDTKKVRMTEYSRFCEHRNILLHTVDLSQGTITPTDPTADWQSVCIRRKTPNPTVAPGLKKLFNPLIKALF